MADSKPNIKGGTFKSVGHLKGMFNKSSAPLITNVQADNTKVVRFLTEPDEWFAYQEYWDNDIRRYIPVADGVEPPVRPSQRFLAQCVDRETDQVIALKMPKDLANRLVLRYDRYNTITDRDYEIMRTGKGLDTSYDVTPEAPTSFESAKYSKLDLLEILETAFNSAMGNENALFTDKPKSTPTDEDVDFVEDDDDIVEDSVLENEPDEDEEDESFFEDIEVETEDETAENMALEESSGEYQIFDNAEEVSEIFEDLDTDFESVEDFENAVWGDDPFTKEELDDMTVGEIKNICKDYDIPVTQAGGDKSKLVDFVISYQTKFISDCAKYAKAKGYYPTK